jgi:putative membrane protein
MHLLVRFVISAATLALAAAVVPGIELRGLGPTLIAAFVFGLVNAVVRPILIVLTFPLTLLTLGLFILVLNALCLWLTSALVPGFDVRGFGPAFLGALVISVVSWFLSAFVT